MELHPPQHGHSPGELHDHAGGHGSTRQYLMVFGALVVLTAVSFVAFRLLGDNPANKRVAWAVMMAVSCMKAGLVMLFFMHLKWEASWKYVLTVPATVMAVFLMVALIPDIGWRFQTIAGGRTVDTRRLERMGFTEGEFPPYSRTGVAPLHPAPRQREPSAVH